MDVSVTRDVAAPAERVWAIVTDLDRAADTIRAIRRVERLDGGSDFAVGTRWRETRLMFRRAATEEMTVTALDPGRSYVTEAAGAGARYRSEVRVEPVDDGRSRLTMTFAAEPTGVVGRIAGAVFSRLLGRSVRKAFREDLEDIARAAEVAG